MTTNTSPNTADMSIEEKRELISGLIREANAKFITITFRKKDGTMREMNIQYAAIRKLIVEEYASPSTEQAVKTRKENHPELMSVYDVQKHAPRSINLDTVTRVVSNGVTYSFS